MGKKIEYSYGEILNEETGSRYLEERPSQPGKPRRALVLCGRCGNKYETSIKEAKRGRCCGECKNDRIRESHVKYKEGKVINQQGTILIKRLSGGRKGIMKCGCCRKEYIASISDVARKNSVCVECGITHSGENRRIYHVGDVIESKNGIHFLFAEELESIMASDNTPTRRGRFYIINTDGSLDSKPFDCQIPSIVNGGVSGKNYSLGMRYVKDWLTKNNYIFQEEVTFKDLQGISGKGTLRFDFMVILPHKKIIIEVDGEQHYRPVEYWGGKANFEKTQKRDELKNLYIEQKKDYEILRIPYINQDTSKFDKILSDYFSQIERGE